MMLFICGDCSVATAKRTQSELPLLLVFESVCCQSYNAIGLTQKVVNNTKNAQCELEFEKQTEMSISLQNINPLRKSKQLTF